VIIVIVVVIVQHGKNHRYENIFNYKPCINAMQEHRSQNIYKLFRIRSIHSTSHFISAKEANSYC